MRAVVVSGLGKAAGFTQLDWVRRQLIDIAGIDPHPGTLNLRIEPAALEHWQDLPGHVLQPAPGFCSARCHAVRIAGRVPAALVLPDVPGYPQDKLELVSALHVRQHLALNEGGMVEVELCRPLAAKAVLFDIDGTLVDSLGAYYEVARQAAEPHGLSVTREQVHHSLSTGGRFWQSIVPGDEALRRTLMDFTRKEWPRILAEHGRAFEGLAQSLDRLKAMGLALGIVSGARAEVLDLLKAVVDRFDVIVLGTDVARRKPDPEGILKALATLRVRPEDAIYVGDSDVDIQAGRAAGAATVGVLTGAASSAMLSRCEPDRLVASLGKLPGLLA